MTIMLNTKEHQQRIKESKRELFKKIERMRGDSNLITPWGVSFDITWEEWQKLIYEEIGEIWT